MNSHQKASYPLLTDALRLLPVQPQRERAELGSARYHAMRTGSGEVRGVRIGLQDLDELFIQQLPGGPRVSPTGASLLLELHRQGAFETVPERQEQSSLELLHAYAEGRACLLGIAYRKRRGPLKTLPVRPPSVTAPVQRPYQAALEPRYRVTVHRIM